MELKKAIEIIEKFGIDYRGYPTLEKAVNVVLEYTKAQLSQEGTTKGATPDLISRQVAIDTFEKAPFGYLPDKWMSIETLEELPPAQPEPKTGVWLTYTNIPQYMLCKCSACGANILVPYLGKNTIFNYCPNYGAKMEGDLT